MTRTAEEIVDAIWARWEERLSDWDLGGTRAGHEARELAIEAVTELYDDDGPGSS